MDVFIQGQLVEKLLERMDNDLNRRDPVQDLFQEGAAEKIWQFRVKDDDIQVVGTVEIFMGLLLVAGRVYDIPLLFQLPLQEGSHMVIGVGYQYVERCHVCFTKVLRLIVSIHLLGLIEQ